MYAKFARLAGHVRRIFKMSGEELHAVKFNQMSGEKLQMSGEAKKDSCTLILSFYPEKALCAKPCTMPHNISHEQATNILPLNIGDTFQIVIGPSEAN